MLWNTETTEFQMKGVAYTGNNMRKHMPAHNDRSTFIKRGMKLVFHSYHSTKKSEKQKTRTSNVPRPSGLVPPKSGRRN